MEDGPESTEGSYEYGGHAYRLDEAESEQWRIYEGDTYLGVVIQTDPTSEEPWMHYAAKSAGEESHSIPTTDDWHTALRHLIDASTH